MNTADNDSNETHHTFIMYMINISECISFTVQLAIKGK